MDIIFDVAREVIVDDCLDLLDVDAARSDISGYHHGPATRLEIAEHSLALALILIAVNNAASNHALKHHAQLVGHALGRREDERARACLKRAEDVAQHVLLVLLRAREVDVLRDVLVGVERVDIAHLDLDGRAQELVRQPAHRLGPRGSVEERLPLRRNGEDNFADLRLKAHVKHAVGFVHHEVGDLTKPDLLRLEEVVDATRCADDHLAALAQLGQLRALALPSVAADRVNPEGAAKFLALDLDLHGELASGGEAEECRPELRVGPRCLNKEEARNEEAERLPRARLRDTNHVAFGHCSWPRLRLNHGGRLEAGAVNSVHYGRR
mmetsp:Transcript_9578/g.29149  ORF Transcript_9578/g.29149 Transcript_9578/m.29149 type:complete len:325 (-) Transcript_9578:485-1459(-)